MSWFKITGFYLVFFTCLGLFSVAMFGIFHKLSISEDRPRWTLADSLIGTNPGVGFRPMPDQDKTPESTLIWIHSEHDKESSYWTDQLNTFFTNGYTNKTGKTCTYGGEKADKEKACDVDVVNIDGCNNETGYGYTGKRATPCVLLKLNRIFDWEPNSYTDASDLPENMPQVLQDKIKSLATSKAKELQSIWITCQGENVADREHLKEGGFEYYTPGVKGINKDFGMIPNYYFPFSKQEYYQSPFIFVRFPKLMRNVLIQVECRAWAQNLDYDRQFRLGSGTHFELMLD